MSEPVDLPWPRVIPTRWVTGIDQGHAPTVQVLDDDRTALDVLADVAAARMGDQAALGRLYGQRWTTGIIPECADCLADLPDPDARHEHPEDDGLYLCDQCAEAHAVLDDRRSASIVRALP